MSKKVTIEIDADIEHADQEAAFDEFIATLGKMIEHTPYGFKVVSDEEGGQ